MKSFALPIALLSILLAPTSRAEDSQEFTRFFGNYSKRGKVVISNGHDARVKGTAKIEFTTAANGRYARLKILGNLQLAETVAHFSTSFLWYPKKNRVLITNLAPGFQDRRSSKGRYAQSRSRIKARVPVEFETARGTATVIVKLRPSPHGAQLTIVQRLETSVLAHPLTWKFSGFKLPD